MRFLIFIVAPATIGTFVGSIVFDHPFTLLNILFGMSALIVGDLLTPLCKVIVCNLRKVSYNG